MTPLVEATRISKHYPVQAGSLLRPPPPRIARGR